VELNGSSLAALSLFNTCFAFVVSPLLSFNSAALASKKSSRDEFGSGSYGSSIDHR